MAALNPAERKALARKAALARWKNRRKKQDGKPELAQETAPIHQLPLETSEGLKTAPPVEVPVEVAAPLPAAAPSAAKVQPPTPPAPQPAITPTLSANLLAARVNAGKHYEGFDWTADPLGANLEFQTKAVRQPTPEATEVTGRIAFAIGDLVAELETPEAGRATAALSAAIQVVAPLTGSSASLHGLDEGKVRETLFLLDEVRLTLNGDPHIAVRSARRALKLWVV